MAIRNARFYIDPMDIKAALNDLGTLGTNVTKKTVIRRALKTSGEPLKKLIERNALNSINDHGQMADSFRWRSGTLKRGYISMFIRSIPKYGGNLTKIFEDGTNDRFTKSGWWTGKIDNGPGKSVPTEIRTKFIQRGFDAEEDKTARKIIGQIRLQVTKVVARSKKLNNR
tara:strand:+ start:11001 stop:11510 length:510 start_codon:yes stop_codon:yes gene_type:complete